MSTELLSFKEALINSGVLKRTPTNRDQYRGMLCPRCGDTKYHCYVKISLTNEDPPLWHCFKCNSGGIVGKEFLKAYHIDDISMPKNMKYHKRIESNEAVSIKLNQVSCNKQDPLDDVIAYTSARVGIHPTLPELQMFRYVGNPHGYVKEFFGMDEYNSNMLNERLWFQLNNGNIIGRTNNDDTEYRWLRYKTNRVRGRGIYTFRTGIDTHEPINVIIAEGIYDCIGLYYHYPVNNALYIATLGSDYKYGIQHIMKMGVFGDSVTIHIFKDADVNTNMIQIPKSLCKLFKHVFVYGNSIAKDYGYPKHMMEIHRVLKIK